MLETTPFVDVRGVWFGPVDVEPNWFRVAEVIEYEIDVICVIFSVHFSVLSNFRLVAKFPSSESNRTEPTGVGSYS